MTAKEEIIEQLNDAPTAYDIKYFDGSFEQLVIYKDEANNKYYYFDKINELLNGSNEKSIEMIDEHFFAIETIEESNIDIEKKRKIQLTVIANVLNQTNSGRELRTRKT